MGRAARPHLPIELWEATRAFHIPLYDLADLALQAVITQALAASAGYEQLGQQGFAGALTVQVQRVVAARSARSVRAGAQDLPRAHAHWPLTLTLQ